MKKESTSKTSNAETDRLFVFQSLDETEQKDIWNLARRHGFRKNDLKDKDLLLTLLIQVRQRSGFGGP